MEKHLCEDISRTALDLVSDERRRQIEGKGYDYAHDDVHIFDELATAAAFYLLPASVDQQIAFITTDSQIDVMQLADLIADATFDVFRRDSDLDVDSPEGLDYRIDTVVRGLALGLAELERLMRSREISHTAEEDA